MLLDKKLKNNSLIYFIFYSVYKQKQTLLKWNREIVEDGRWLMYYVYETEGPWAKVPYPPPPLPTPCHSAGDHRIISDFAICPKPNSAVKLLQHADGCLIIICCYFLTVKNGAGTGGRGTDCETPRPPPPHFLAAFLK